MHGVRHGDVRDDDGRFVKFKLRGVRCGSDLGDGGEHRLHGLQCWDLRSHHGSVVILDKLLGVCGGPVLSDDRQLCMHRLRRGDLRYFNGRRRE